MSVLERYNKLTGTATSVGQSQKTKDKFADKAATQGSPNLKQATSPTNSSTFAPAKGLATFEEQMFVDMKR